eukprot:14960079-Ditylum_brightwellii.AAC.2
MIGIVGKHQDQILEAQQEKSVLGRWSYVSLAGKDRKITSVLEKGIEEPNQTMVHRHLGATGSMEMRRRSIDTDRCKF